MEKYLTAYRTRLETLMKLASGSRVALLASFGVLVLGAAACSQGQAPVDDHEHARQDREDHADEHV